MVRSWSRVIGFGTFALFLSIARPTSSTSPACELKRRAVQSEAVCIDQFNWMDNSMQQSPCTVAAYLLTACAGGNWDICEATPDHHYTPPNATNANGCRCSWAVYNTLQACADCQGQNYDSAIISWSGYNGNCTGSLLSDTDYYPEDTPIPDETAIPFWATTNPSQWHDGRFDPSMAQSIANQGKSDITENNRSSSSSSNSGNKTNKGAIAGGVVGGTIALLALISVLVYNFIRLRRRRIDNISRTKSTFKSSSVRFSPLSHSRSDSDTSVPGQGYAYTSKYGAKGNGQYTLTPSPGPTLPVSIMTSGGKGRPPLNSLPSSSSYNTTQPGQCNTSVGGLAPMGMVLTNNHPTRTMTMSVSSAYATAPSVSRNSHANGSTAEEPVEGAIDPYILPLVLPDPVGSGGGTTRAGRKPGHGHVRGTSESSAQSSQEHNIDTAVSSGRRPPPERRNPPAYASLLPLSPPGIIPPTEEGASASEGEGEDGMSVETQRMGTTLSGTTLDGQGSGANAVAIPERGRKT